MADNNEEETWSVQHRLLLSNALEVMPSQNWPAISRLVRHFSLSATFNGDPVSYVAKDCIAQQDLLIKDYDEIVKKISMPSETAVDLKLKPSTYSHISSSLRRLRLKELRNTIKSQEADIRRIRREIQAVRGGQRDSTFAQVRATALGVTVDEMHANDAEESKSGAELKAKLLELLEKLSSSKPAKPFLEPVKAEDVPTYHTIIKKPLDLGTITSQIENGTLATRYEVMFCVMLMCKNAMTFNAPGTEIYNTANRLKELAIEEADAIFGPVPHYDAERTTRSRSRT